MEEYLKTMGKISGDLWKVFKAYCTNFTPQSDAWWNDLTEALNATAKAYYGTEYEKYARAYACELLCEIERLSRRKEQ